jgi:hypothetical protein
MHKDGIRTSKGDQAPSLTSSSTLVVVVVGPADSTPKGLAIDIFNFGVGHCRTPTATPPKVPAFDVFFNFGGGRCWTYWQHPPRSMPSTSSLTSVVAAAGPTSSTPKGPLSTSSSTSVVVAAELVDSTLRGGDINVLQQVVAVASFFW